MSPTLPPIVLLEPQSLLGRELLQLMEERDLRPERLVCRHLGGEPEHRVTEILGSAEVVPPLGEGALPAGSVVVIAAPPEGEVRERLESALAADPTLPVLDIAGTGLVEGPVLAGAPAVRPDPPRAVVASPGAAVAYRLARPLREFGIEAVWVAVAVPASAEGMEAVEALARHARGRLQGAGGEPKGAWAAFDLLTGWSGRTGRELAALLPGTAVAAVEARAGTFHGWAVHVGVRFGAAVDGSAVREAWESVEGLELAGEPLRLTAVTESDAVHVATPVLSADGRTLAVTALADGLRVGGAATALEILPALV